MSVLGFLARLASPLALAQELTAARDQAEQAEQSMVPLRNIQAHYHSLRRRLAYSLRPNEALVHNNIVYVRDGWSELKEYRLTERVVLTTVNVPTIYLGIWYTDAGRVEYYAFRTPEAAEAWGQDRVAPLPAGWPQGRFEVQAIQVRDMQHTD